MLEAGPEESTPEVIREKYLPFNTESGYSSIDIIYSVCIGIKGRNQNRGVRGREGVERVREKKLHFK